jgi:hypothetical protein
VERKVRKKMKIGGGWWGGVGGGDVSTKPKTSSEILSVSKFHEGAAVANERRNSSTIIWISI